MTNPARRPAGKKKGSKIQWCHDSWNYVRGCSRVSAGCMNCYAEDVAWHRMGGPGGAYEGLVEKPQGKRPRWTGKIRVAQHKIRDPLARQAPTVWFVNSMSDLFHEDLQDEWIDVGFAVMLARPDHVFQPLTKRAARMREYIESRLESGGVPWERAAKSLCRAGLMTEDQLDTVAAAADWAQGDFDGLPGHIWFGVSAENQAAAAERIPELLRTPAAVRWVSAEPLLGAIDLTSWLRRLHWIVAGGESGDFARYPHPSWFTSLRDQCAAAGTAFFFKQWGRFAPFDRTSAEDMLRLAPGFVTLLGPDGVPLNEAALDGEAARVRDGHPLSPDLVPVAASAREAAGFAQLDGRYHLEFPCPEHPAVARLIADNTKALDAQRLASVREAANTGGTNPADRPGAPDGADQTKKETP